MSVYLEAAEEVEREMARAAGRAAVAADLKRVGSLQNAADEAQARIDKLALDEAQAVADFETKRAAAAAELTETSRQRDEMVKRRLEVSAEAARLAREATEQAADIIAHAKSDAATIKGEAEDKGAQLKTATENNLVRVRQEIAALETTRADLEGQVAQRQATLDNLNAQIAAIKARF